MLSVINMGRKGFTLLELMLVVVIVGIIATFAIPGYLGVRQRAEGRQASTQLRLIRTAERVGYLESDSYVGCIGFALCNTALDLDLPNDGWAYSVTVIGGPGFLATAAKGGCSYTIGQTSAPMTSAGCVFVP